MHVIIEYYNVCNIILRFLSAPVKENKEFEGLVEIAEGICLRVQDRFRQMYRR